MRPQLKAVLTTLLLIAAGCDEQPATDVVDNSIQQVVVTATLTEIEAGETTQLTAVAKQADGTVRNATIQWSVNDTTIGQVYSTSINTAYVRGKKAGTVEVQAKAESKAATIHVAVKQTPVPNPIPKLNQIEPASATEGDAGTLLHVKGENFTPQSYVAWNAVAKQTIYVSAGELNVILTPADLQSAGEAHVKVVTPGPGGGNTADAIFTIFGPPASLILATEAWPEIFLPGEQATIQLVVKDRTGRTLPPVQATWETSIPGVATIDQTGKLTMVGPGQTAVRARVGTLVKEGYVNVASAPTADVIYDALENGVRQLFITTPGNGTRRKVFSDVVQATQPAPSPDGQRIAYVGVGTNGSADIFIANRDGSNRRQLTFDGLVDDQPVWSPDGQRIAFRSQRNSGYNDIWVMNADGSGQHNVTDDQIRVNMTGYEHPAWSPDGEYLLFSMSDYGMTPRRSVLVRLRLSNQTRTIVVNDPALSDAEPAYGTRTNWLAFRRTFSNGLGDQIQFLNPLTGETWIMIDYPGPGRNPAISPENAWVAFESSPANAPGSTGVYINWIGAFYRRAIGVGVIAGNPANPKWIAR